MISEFFNWLGPAAAEFFISDFWMIKIPLMVVAISAVIQTILLAFKYVRDGEIFSETVFTDPFELISPRSWLSATDPFSLFFRLIGIGGMALFVVMGIGVIILLCYVAWPIIMSIVAIAIAAIIGRYTKVYYEERKNRVVVNYKKDDLSRVINDLKNRS